MNSETPKADARTSQTGHNSATESATEEQPGSLGLEVSENIQMHDGAGGAGGGGGQGVDSIDPGAMLMPHERKLPLSEQRQILAMRRHVDDDDETAGQDIRNGRRFRRMYGHVHDHGAREDERGTGHHRGKSRRSTGEHHADAIDANGQSTTPEARPAKDKHSTAATGQHAPLDDAANPNKPLFEAVHKGISNLDPSKVSLTSAEHTNITGALTANMLHTPGFHRANPDPTTISITASDNGDRIFAVNTLNPGSPSAVYTSVVVDEARRQPLEVSTALAAAQQSVAPAPTAAHEQLLQGESPTPRSIA